MPRNRGQPPKDTSEVNLCIKYLVFGFNVFFWILGAFLIAVSIWSYGSKGSFNNFGKITGTTWLDPVLAILLVGVLMFIIGFFGCIGALRENTILLMLYYLSLGAVLVFFLVVAIVGFLFRNKVENSVKKSLLNMIVNYREDEDLQFIIDWAQKDWLHCCGVDNPDDWNSNIYFNCSSKDKGSVEGCGVPYSCCDKNSMTNDNLINTQCGYDTRINSPSYASNIYTTGCIDSGKSWLNKNIIPIAGALVGMALLQILFIYCSCNLKSQVESDRKRGLYKVLKF